MRRFQQLSSTGKTEITVQDRSRLFFMDYFSGDKSGLNLLTKYCAMNYVGTSYCYSNTPERKSEGKKMCYVLGVPRLATEK